MLRSYKVSAKRHLSRYVWSYEPYIFTEDWTSTVMESFGRNRTKWNVLMFVFNSFAAFSPLSKLNSLNVFLSCFSNKEQLQTKKMIGHWTLDF